MRTYRIHPTSLRQLKGAKGCSWATVARKAGVNEGTVYAWLKGRQEALADSVGALAEYFSCTVGQLTGEEPCTAPQIRGQPRVVLRIVIELVGDASSYSENTPRALMSELTQFAISRGFVVGEGDMEHASTHFGSIFIVLKMREDLAREIERAAKNNELLDAGILDAEIEREPMVSLGASVPDAPHEISYVIAAGSAGSVINFTENYWGTTQLPGSNAGAFAGMWAIDYGRTNTTCSIPAEINPQWEGATQQTFSTFVLIVSSGPSNLGAQVIDVAVESRGIEDLDEEYRKFLDLMQRPLIVCATLGGPH